MKYLLFLIIFMISIPLFAQDTVDVSFENSVINGSIIEPYHNKWNVSLYKKGKLIKEKRLWTDYVQVFEINGIDYIHRVQDLYDNKGGLSEIWINVVRRNDLKPVRYSRITTKGELEHIDFGNQILKVSNRDTSGLFIKKKFKLDQDIYDWNLYGMLLVGLPFQENISYKIPFWSQEEKTIDTLITTLEGREEIETLSGSTYNTTKVVTDKGLTFWLVKEKPYVIQLELALPNGSTMIWKMMKI